MTLILSPVIFQMVYCTEANCYNAHKESIENGDASRPQETAGAYVAKTKIWRGRDVLKVYFMNPDYLSQGTYPLTLATVVSWAKTWSTSLVPNIPKFEQTDSVENADIKVKFGGKNKVMLV